MWMHLLQTVTPTVEVVSIYVPLPKDQAVVIVLGLLTAVIFMKIIIRIIDTIPFA